jgi:predicted unusual protein kinase regulating ubiquinone biosynthesis (AarF/ABC1/UbiB family)
MNSLAFHSAPVPAGRADRLMHLGGLAVGLAGGMLAEGAKQAATGRLPPLRDMLLTPGNAARLSDRLSRLRGAAMKLGQLMSMEAGELLPPEFTAVLLRLRQDAHFMPLGQLADLLDANWGAGWEGRFEHFSFTPMAAASIGQVHEARLKDGRRLAIKVQYPGVARSIDSDVDNVAALFRLFPLLPREARLDELLADAKTQLHQEADYLLEATHLRQFRKLLEGEQHLVVPEVVDELTTANVLAMSFVPGLPLEQLASTDQERRDRVAGWLIDLLFREFLEFGMVQTDPNFANYRYDPERDCLGLLDFGATRAYSPERLVQVRGLLVAATQEDPVAVEAAAEAAGYLDASDPAQRRQAVVDLFLLVGEPARQAGPFDFAGSSLVTRLRDSAYVMTYERGQWRPPPAELIFLHRKLGGLFLLCARIGARVDVASVLDKRLEMASGQWAKGAMAHVG